jgi:DNA-binding response OmpR family regulator
LTNRKAKILVLDEDPLALELYSRELNKEYDVLTSMDVTEGIASLETYRPDVVIIEPATGNYAGWELMKAALSEEQPPNVILCSTLDDCPRQSYLGIDHYLVKPVLPVTLHTLIDQVLVKRRTLFHQRLDQD